MLKKIDNMVTNCTFKLDSILKLIPRLIIGMVFIPAGWGKLNDLDRTIGFFTTLGIPLPQIQAPLVAGVEFIFGALVLIGLFTRISTLPLIATMAVALLTAHRADFASIYSVTEIMPALYLVILLCILALGAGTISADRFRKK